jgi:hypothetical protein
MKSDPRATGEGTGGMGTGNIARLSNHAPTERRSKDHRTRETAVLPELLTVSKFWRNRGGKAVFVQLKEYEGHALIERVFVADREGKSQPTGTGKLPQLAAALNNALGKARELGLVDEEDGS